MIQGLGAKHKDMLPAELENDAEEADDQEHDEKGAEKVRKWASSVPADAADKAPADVDKEAEDRQQRFERPLREIRVGESPSRPWGISVPAKYLEEQNQGAVGDRADVNASPEMLDPRETRQESVPLASTNKLRSLRGMEQTCHNQRKERLGLISLHSFHLLRPFIRRVMARSRHVWSSLDRCSLGIALKTL